MLEVEHFFGQAYNAHEWSEMAYKTDVAICQATHVLWSQEVYILSVYDVYFQKNNNFGYLTQRASLEFFYICCAHQI